MQTFRSLEALKASDVSAWRMCSLEVGFDQLVRKAL